MPRPAAVLVSILVLCLAVWLVPAPAGAAQELAPFSVPNQSPLALALLPFSPAPARIAPQGADSFRLSAAYSSVFAKEYSSKAGLNLDLEMYSVSARFDRVAAEGVQLGVELPFFGYWGGFLDGFIEDYHRALGLPNAGREKVERNLTRYEAAYGGRAVIARRRPACGPGDIRFYGRTALLREDKGKPALSLLAQVGLPTGDKQKGLGAGGATFGAGLAGEKHLGRFWLNSNAMFFYLKETDMAEPLNVQNAAAASATLGYAWSPDLELLLQFNGATPLFADTGVAGLDNGLLQVVLGFQYALNRAQGLRLSLAEDLIHDSSPDFTLGLEWAIGF